MCGLVAVVHDQKIDAELRKQLTSFTKDMLRFGVVRGEDSTGMFQVRGYSGDVKQRKLPYNGFIFLEDEHVEEMVRNVDISYITVAHHRAATVGSVNITNAHPFEHTVGERHVIGAHNGRIDGWYAGEDGLKFTVDSDWALYQIAKMGSAKGVGSLNGAMALLWYEYDKKLRLYANEKRPFHWAYIKDQNAMIAASEHAMLWCAAARNGLEIEDTFWTPSDEYIHVFDPENVRKFELIKLDTSEKKHVVSAGTTTTSAWSGGGGRQLTGPTSSTSYTTNTDMKTFQGFPVSYSAVETRRLEVEPGARVEVHKTKDIVPPEGHPNFGVEIMAEGLDKQIIMEYAIIMNATQEMRDSMEYAWANNGEVFCRVLGVTTVEVAGIRFMAAVLSPPINVVGKSEVLGQRQEDIPFDLLTAEEAEAQNQIKREIPGPRGMMSDAAFREAVKHGCANCTMSLTPKDAKDGKISWFRGHTGDEPFCEDCAAQLDERTYH